MRLLIANVNNSEAIVQLTLYKPDGTTAASTRFTLDADAQRIFEDSDVLLTNFIGAVVVETNLPVAASSAISRADPFDTEQYTPFRQTGLCRRHCSKTHLSNFDDDRRQRSCLLHPRERKDPGHRYKSGSWRHGRRPSWYLFSFLLGRGLMGD